jgi:molybdopterin synthase sulfur carrier subunit
MAGSSDTLPSPQVTVTLTHALVRLFPEAQTTLTLEAATVNALLDALDARWPGMRDRLADSSPAIRRHINVFVDGRKATLDTELRDGSEVYVLTAMSGG